MKGIHECYFYVHDTEAPMSLRPVSSKSLSDAIERANRARSLFRVYEETERKIFENYDNLQTRMHKTKSPWGDSERYTLMTEAQHFMWEVFFRVKRMSLIVTGANSSGKSTFINKMVGHKLLPRGVGSLTKRILRITFAEKGKQCVEVYSNVEDAVALRNRLDHDVLDNVKDMSKVVKKHLEAEWEDPAEDYEIVEGELAEFQEDEMEVATSRAMPKLTKEQSDWMEKVVVIRLCSPILKNGLDFYDTPGPDLEMEADYELLRDNCVNLLRLLDPFALVVFLIHNPSNPPNVQAAHGMVMNTIGKYDGVKPTLLYIYNRMDLHSIQNNDSVQDLYDEHEDDPNMADELAFNYVKVKCKETFAKSINAKELYPDGFHFEGVSMIDRSEFMENRRIQLAAKIDQLSVQRMDSMTTLLLESLQVSIYRYTEQLSSVRAYTDAEIQERVHRANEVRSLFQELYSSNIHEILDDLPAKMEGLLNGSRRQIMQDFQKNRIKRLNRPLIKNYFATQKEIAQRVSGLIERYVSTPFRAQLIATVTKAIDDAFSTAFERYQWKAKEEKDEIVRDIFELSELSKVSAVQTEGLFSFASSALGMASSLASTTALDATAIAGFAMAAIGAAISTGILAFFLYKASRPIDQAIVETWVTKALSRVSKSFQKLDKDAVKKELDGAIERLIFSKLDGNILRFQNAEIMKSELPMIKDGLQRHLGKLGDIHFDVFSLLYDVGAFEEGGPVGCGSFGVVRKMVVAGGEEGPGRVFKIAGISDEEDQCFLNEVIGLAYTRWKRIPHTVHLLGTMRVEDEKRALVLREYSCDLQQHLQENPMLEWETVLNMAEQIAYAVQSMHNYRILHRDLKTNNVFLDEEGNCYLGDFGALSFGVYNNELFGSLPLPPELEAIYVSGDNGDHADYDTGVDIWGVGVILFELIPKATYEHPETVDKLHRRITELRASPAYRNAQGYMKVVEACLHRDPSKRIQASELVNSLREARWSMV